MRKLLLLLTILLPELIWGQEDSWNNYLAQFENGPGSVVLNMDIIKRAPMDELPFIVITGVKLNECDENGFPKQSEFKKLYQISDSIINTIGKISKAELVGTFTYQCERLDYIYVHDSTELRMNIEKTFKTLFPEYATSISIRNDREWSAYKKFLFPNEITFEYMSNKSVIDKLIEQGDNLKEPRQVDHWLYFYNKKDSEIFAKVAKNLSFNVEGIEHIKKANLPYQVHLSRIDNVDIESITKITIQLRDQAKKYNGEYDGWETFIIKE